MKMYFSANGLLHLKLDLNIEMNQIKYKIIGHWKNNFLINALVFESENYFVNSVEVDCLMSMSMHRRNIFKMNQKYKILKFSDKNNGFWHRWIDIFIAYLDVYNSKKYSAQMNLHNTKLTLFGKNCNYVIYDIIVHLGYSSKTNSLSLLPNTSLIHLKLPFFFDKNLYQFI